MNKAATITTVLAGALVAGYLVLAPDPAPPAITLAWDDTNSGAITFNLYSGPEPRPSTMWLLTNVASHSVTLPATNGQQFFALKALRDGLESGWAEVAR